MWEGRGIGEWLQVSLEELADTEHVPQLVRRAAGLCAGLGLGHLALGRSLPTLSGGEAQRLRVATALLESGQGREGPGNILFVMDEPAAGLHPADVQRLVTAFRRIVSEGHSLLLIEHNLAVLRESDWVVDLGPGCGSEGGRVLFSGPVADLLRADVPGSRTLAALRGYTSGDDTRPEAGAAEREDSASGVDAVSAFATYLSRDQERPDESPPLSTRPAYRIHDRPESRGIDDGLALLGLALPLYRLFASESSVPGQTVYPDQDSAVAAALAALTRKPRSLVGYFPLTQQLASEDVTPDELVAAVRDALRTGATGWFDGEAVQSRPPAGKNLLTPPSSAS